MVNIEVFDLDAVVLKELWKASGTKVFDGCVRYYLSDHRPMWTESGGGVMGIM